MELLQGRSLMGILTTLAQYPTLYDDSYYNSYDAGYGAAGAVLGLVFFTFYIFLILAIYAFTSICLMKIFKKANVPQWIAWVPFYNNWKMLEIGGQQGFWSVLLIVPVVSIVSLVYIFIAQYHIGKKLDKGGEFVLWAIFIPVVWYIWLAFDKSKWNDKASTAPSLNKVFIEKSA